MITMLGLVFMERDTFLGLFNLIRKKHAMRVEWLIVRRKRNRIVFIFTVMFINGKEKSFAKWTFS